MPHAGEAVSEELRIRAMAESDIDAVKALAAGLAQGPHWEVLAYKSAILRARALDGVALVGEVDESGLTGFIIGGIVPPEAEIEFIAVRPEVQRQGMARRLFAAFASEVRRLGCASILLEVRASNGAARAFYAAQGFAETGRRPAYYSDPVEDAILMSRQL